MKVILTGGVTGGHIYPALAIGDKFRELQPDCEIIFIGSGLGLESEIVPKHGYDFKTVSTGQLDRKNILKLIGTAAGIKRGMNQALKIMKSFKPDVVISTGSFVSVPVVRAAHKYGARIFIHEQNAFPGLANRSLSKYADKIFLGFRTAADYFKGADNVLYSGNPVRADFYNPDRAAARKKLGIAIDDFMIFYFGGSLGADTINEAAVETIEKYADKEGIRILFGTGNRYYKEVLKELTYRKLSSVGNAEVRPYIEEMPDVLAASDVIISRSGALSVAEITVSGRAAIFIPSPNVTGDHQYYNAKEIADCGGAVIVHDDENTTANVLKALEQMICEPEFIRELEEGSHKCAPLDATNIIYEVIMKICEDGNAGGKKKHKHK